MSVVCLFSANCLQAFLCIIFRRGVLLGRQPCRPIWCSVRRMSTDRLTSHPFNLCSNAGSTYTSLPVALLSSVACELAPLRIVLLCVFLYLFFYFFTSLLIRVSSAMIMYDRRTLLDIGQRYTNLIKDTLSADPAWPLEILRSTELNNDRLNNRRRRRKHRGRRAGIRNRLRKRAHSPPLPSILLANVQSLENKMDDLRARISFQRDIRDCNIFCLTETWLTPLVPDTAVTPSDNFSVLRMDRSAEAGKTKVVECVSLLTRNGVTPGISPFCRVPVRLIWSISPLSAAPSICPGNLHRSSCLPFIFLHKQTLAWLCPISTMKSADMSTNIPTLLVLSLGTLTRPTSRKSCRTFINIYPVQPEDWIHWITATLRSITPTKPTHCRLLQIRSCRHLSHAGIQTKDRSRAAGGEGSDALVPHSEAMLQASLDDVDWDMFRASSSDVSEFTDVAVSFVNTLTEQATETVTIRTFTNQKPWVDRSIRDAVNNRTAAYNAGLLSGNMSEYKTSCYAPPACNTSR